MVDAEPEDIADTDDALDDGFPYEHMGNEIELRWSSAGWVAPTPFMVVSLKELLRELVKMYGRQGHWLLREIGLTNLRDPSWIQGLGLAAFCGLYDTALKAIPEDDSRRLGFIE